MSSDSSLWPVVTPDFIYILKIGDFDHVLRPADQKASENLALAKMAVGHIDVARNLLTERGPFLLAEKQLKMDELIGDTEEAINRVIRLLKPARVEQVSGDSIRINTKNPWKLESEEPKAAATFARLRITHEKLKTVVHDLEHIEATAQLDNCEVRATAASPPTSDQARPLSTTEESLQLQQGGQQLLAMRRGRRDSRQTLASEASSISRATSDELDPSDPRSPISQGNTMMGTLSDSPQHSRRSSIGALLTTETLQDDLPEAVAERLPVIHELEASPSGPLSLPKSDTSVEGEPLAIHELILPTASTSTGESKLKEHSDKGNPKATTRSPQGSSTKGSRAQAVLEKKRESFSKYRRRKRDSWQEPQPGSSTLESAIESEGQPHLDIVIPKSPEPFDMETVSAVSVQSAWAQLATVTTAKQVHHGPKAQAQQIVVADPNAASRPAPTQSESTRMPPIEAISTTPPRELPQPLPATPQSAISPSRAKVSPHPQTPSSVLNSGLNAQPLPNTQRHAEIVSIDPQLMRLPSLLRPGKKGPSSNILPPYPVSDAGSDQEDNDQLGDLDPTQRSLPTAQRSATAPAVSNSDSPPTRPPISHADETIHNRSLSETAVPQISFARAPTIPRKPLPYRNSLPVVPTASTVEAKTAPPNVMLQVQPQKSSRQEASGPPSPLDPTSNTLLIPRQSSNSMVSLSVQAPSSMSSSRRSSVSVEEQSVAKPPVPAPKHPSSSPQQQMPPSAPVQLLRSTSPQTMIETSSDHETGPSSPKQERASPPPHLEIQTGATVPVTEQQAPEIALDTRQPRPGKQEINSPSRSSMPNGLAMNPPIRSPAQPSAYQTQSATVSPDQRQWMTSQIDYRSPAFQQMRHFYVADYTIHQNPMPIPHQSQSRFRDADQSRPSAPTRNRTVPDPSMQAQQAPSTSLFAPRRASEQSGSTTLPSNEIGSPSISQMQHKLPSGPGHVQDSSNVSRPYLTPAQQHQARQPEQAAFEPRSVIRTGPPATRKNNDGPPQEPEFATQGFIHNQNAGKRNSNVRELFGKHVWSPVTDRRVVQDFAPPDQQLRSTTHTAPSMAYPPSTAHSQKQTESLYSPQTRQQPAQGQQPISSPQAPLQSFIGPQPPLQRQASIQSRPPQQEPTAHPHYQQQNLLAQSDRNSNKEQKQGRSIASPSQQRRPQEQATAQSQLLRQEAQAKPPLASAHELRQGQRSWDPAISSPHARPQIQSRHSCHCDDDTASAEPSHQMTKATALSTVSSAKSPVKGIATEGPTRLPPLHEGQIAKPQPFSSTYKSIDIPDIPSIEPIVQVPAQRTFEQIRPKAKKRSSWLSHQASLLTRGRGGS